MDDDELKSSMSKGSSFRIMTRGSKEPNKGTEDAKQQIIGEGEEESGGQEVGGAEEGGKKEALTQGLPAEVTEVKSHSRLQVEALGLWQVTVRTIHNEDVDNKYEYEDG